MQTESSESNGYEQPAASAPAPAEDRSWTVKINFRSWSLHYACSMFSSASSSNCSSNEVFRLVTSRRETLKSARTACHSLAHHATS